MHNCTCIKNCKALFFHFNLSFANSLHCFWLSVSARVQRKVVFSRVSDFFQDLLLAEGGNGVLGLIEARSSLFYSFRLDAATFSCIKRNRYFSRTLKTGKHLYCCPCPCSKYSSSWIHSNFSFFLVLFPIFIRFRSNFHFFRFLSVFFHFPFFERISSFRGCLQFINLTKMDFLTGSTPLKIPLKPSWSPWSSA